MRVIPVLDLMRGEVVRGVGGRRDEYRAIRSRLVDSALPLDVARAFRAQFGLSQLYVADLDALRGGTPQLDEIRSLAGEGFELLVDAGLRDIERGRVLLQAGAARVIAALETSRGPEHLRAVVRALGRERVTFSLDLKAGRLLGDTSAWESASGGSQQPEARARDATHDPSLALRANVCNANCVPASVDVALHAVECGVRSLIVLDLAGVGKGQGVPTIPLCRRLRADCGDLQIITGGGVRNADDLRELLAADVNGVLVASALHDGRLTPANLAALRRSV